MVGGEGLQHLPFDGVPCDHPDRVAVLSAVPALPVDEARQLFGSVIFGRLNTTFALPGARAAVEAFAPDLVLHDAAELSVRIAAELVGVPQVAVNPSLTIPAFVTSAAEGVSALRSGLGLDPDAQGIRMLTGPTVSGFPASFDFPEAVDFDVHRFRDPELPGAGSGNGPVYVTLGSEAHSLPFFGAVLREVVAGALTVGLPVLVSTGADIDDDVFAGLEGDLRVERWVDQAEVMTRASAVVCHGGSGSTLGALTAGVPLVVVPLFADQPDNAERVVATDTGRRVDPADPDLAGRVGSALRDILGQRPAGSARIAADIAALPTADDVAAWLASLVG